jgi:hypothetical protein
MRILLTGDWQSHQSNLDLSARAFERELHLIQKHKVNVHIDLGDSKEEYSPVAVAVTNFQHFRAAEIAKRLGAGNCYRLMGNHDRIGQHADDRNWLRLFSDHAKCITSPYIEVNDKVKLCFLPFCKDVETAIVGAKSLAFDVTSAHVKLLFFHLEIATAKFNNVSGLKSTSKLTPKLLWHNMFKRCFGGHIHKRQTIADNIHYVGNPFPTDAGEVNQEKGFVLYDTKTNKVSFVPSHLPGIYTYDYLMNNDIDSVVDGSQIRRIVSINADEDYYEKLDKVNRAIMKKYPNAIPYVIPSFKEEKNDEMPKIDIEAPEPQQIKQYLDVTIDHNEKDRAGIEAYMNFTLGIVSRRTAYAKGLVFDDVIAHNILSWRDVQFSFRKKGICLVRGVNKDWKNHSNGAGKTNLLSLIPIAHSGRTFKGQKFATLVHEKWPEEKGWVRLNMHTRSGDALEIYRQFNPSKLIFTVNGKDASQGMRSSGKKDTQGLIEEYTGYTFAMLANSVYIDQSLTQGFLQGTEKDRAELLHKFQNLDRFTLAQKLVVKDISSVKQYLVQAEHGLELHKALHKETEDRIAELQDVQSKHLANLVANWRKHKKKLDKVADSHRRTADGFAYELKKLKAHHALATKELHNIDGNLGAEQSLMAARKRELALLLKATASAKCSYCQQAVSPEHKKALRISLKKEIAVYTQQVEKIQAARSTAHQEIVELEERISSLEGKKDEIENRLKALEEAVIDAKRLYIKEKETVGAKSLKVYKEKLRVLALQIEIHKKLRSYYKELQGVAQFAYKAFGREGLPLFLNKLACPRLNAASKVYSELFVDGEIQVVFVIEDDRLMPKIINSHGSKSIIGQSTGEKAWASIITAFALRDISQPTNLLIFDEPGHGLDPAGAKQLGSRLNKLTMKYETLLVVTHNQIIESALADKNTVTVVKKDMQSKIV